MASTWYVDLNNGNDSNNGTSFAQRVKTLSRAAALAAAGDTVRVMGTASSSSGTATWTVGSSLVTLSGGLAQIVYADGNWTASTNVTCSTVTSSPSPKQGSNCVKIVCASGFTTGKVAYYAIGSALNLSGYQQVSFWVQATTTIASGALSINLCSDTSGNTIVNTLTLNVALNANKWTCVTINNAAALGSSIQTVRLTANSSLASKTIYIDNIVACNATSAAGCLTLSSLISADDVNWYPVQSVDGTSVYVDAQSTTAATSAPGFQGSTGSTTFYMLQPTQVAIETASTTFAQTFSGNGSSGNPITISGGWDSTAMTSQVGWTIIDLMDWTGSGVNLTGTTGYITLNHFGFVRCTNPVGVVTTCKGYTISNGIFAGTGSFTGFPSHGMSLSSCTFMNTSGTTAMINIPQTANYNTDGVAWSISNCNIWGANVDGIDVPAFIGSPGITITGCNCSGTSGYGFNIQSICGGGFYNNTANKNTNPGFYFQNMNDFLASNLTAQGNGTAQVQLNNAWVEIYTLNTNTSGGSSLPQINFPASSTGEAVVYSWTQYTGSSPAAKLTSLGDPATGETAGNVVYSHREGATAVDNSIYSDYGTITTTGITPESTGLAWQLSPNGNSFSSSPLRLNVGKIACPANDTTTVTFYAQLSNASLNARLRVFGGRYPGVGSPGTDVTTSVTSVGSYAQYSIAFEPTEACVVDVFFEAWGGTTYNATISGPVSVLQ